MSVRKICLKFSLLFSGIIVCAMPATALQVTQAEVDAAKLEAELKEAEQKKLIAEQKIAEARNAITKAEAEAEQVAAKAEAEATKAIAAANKAAAADNNAAIESKLSNLPQFDGGTTLNDGALDIEAHLMAMIAVKGASKRIASDMTGSTDVLVIPETLSVGWREAKILEINIHSAIILLDEQCKPTNNDRSCIPSTVQNFGFVEGLAVFKAIGGLLRTTTAVSGRELEDIDDHLLAIAATTEIDGATFVDDNTIIGDMENTDVVIEYKKLEELIGVADASKQQLDAQISATDQNDKEKKIELLAKRNALKLALDSARKFRAELLEPSAKNEPSQLAKAASTQAVFKLGSSVLRINIVRAGASIISVDNIGVTFGDDPLRVSAGLIAEWTLQDISKGTLRQQVGYVFCWTAPKSFRRIQHGNWLKDTFDKLDKTNGKEQCRSEASNRFQPAEIRNDPSLSERAAEEETTDENDYNSRDRVVIPPEPGQQTEDDVNPASNE